MSLPGIVIQIGADTADAIDGINKVNTALGDKLTGPEKFGAAINKSVVPAIGVLTAVGAGAFVASQKAADLAETQSKVGVIFGDSVDQLQDWAKAAPLAIGQSEQAALDASATFATFGKSAGLAGSDLVEFSTHTVDLASDLASFHNAEPQEVVDALGAAMRGEAEGMRKYGVLLDDATLKASAMELGIYSGTGALTAQQKVLAAQAAIMDQTGDAQGDFARTSSGAANQQRILNATTEQLTTELGGALLPILQTVTSGLASFAGWARENQGLVMALVAAIVIIAGTILVLKVAMEAWTIAQWALNAAMSANPIVLIVLAVAAFIAAIVLAYNKVDWFRAFIDAAWSGIQTVIGAVVGWFQDNVVPALAAAWDAIAAAARVVVEWFQDYVAPVLGKVIDAVKAYFTAYWTVVKFVWERVRDAVEVVVEWFQDYVAPVLGKVIDAVKAYFTAYWTVVSTVWSKVQEAIRVVVDWITTTVAPAIGAQLELITGAFSTAGEFIVGVWNTITEFLGGLVDTFKDIGGRIVQGVRDGFSNAWNSFLSWVAEQVNKLPDVAKHVLGIASPSRVFRSIGEDVVDGWRLGLAGMDGVSLDAAASANTLIGGLSRLDVAGSSSSSSTSGAGSRSADVLVTEDQVYRALAQLLMRGDARGGRVVLVA